MRRAIRHMARMLGTVALTLVCALGATQTAFAAGSQAISSVVRLSGSTRIQTAVASSVEGFPEGSQTVLVANAMTYPDALSASGLAGMYGCPIVLTDSSAAGGGLSPDAKTEIQRLGAESVYILGGPNAVSTAAEDELNSMVGSANVVRLGGATRIETNQIIYQQGLGKWSDTCIVATGGSFADALTAAPYAYAAQVPVFLTNADGTLPAETADIIRSNFSRAIVMGGNSAIPSGTEQALDAMLGGANVVRFGGATRIETASLFVAWATGGNASAPFQPSEAGKLSYANAGVARAWDFPDALTAINVLGPKKGAILLCNETSGGETQGSIAGKLGDKGIECAYLFGGLNAIPQQYETWARMAINTARSANVQVYIAAHQDDDLLTMGGGIVSDLSAGKEVYVVLCTDGSASRVRGVLQDGGTCDFHEGTHSYTLSRDEFVAARDREFRNACSALGLDGAHIVILPGRSADKGMTVDRATGCVEDILAAFPNATVHACSPLVGDDQHSDHRNLGQAALDLYKEGTLRGLMCHVEPYLVDEFEENNPQVNLIERKVTDSVQVTSIDNARSCYSNWDPANASYAIGYHSVGAYFDNLKLTLDFYEYAPAR